ncbi:hypothetical protein [Amycolatopsis sp. RTGN1]|uniref:hypothetical protein n=1 Tax=Amycolatopsis ponsaeliensis TaxID=2992142 RepID=UPI00254A7CAC|nr:hypothetical protein [Amycolatopsis sp. RTGN1]
MIRDYLLALLSVPLAAESAPARFATDAPWDDILARWLTRARELDGRLDFDLSPHPAGLSLRTRHPLAATVTLALVTEPDVVPEADGDLLVVLACCPQWTIECDDGVLLVEPRWAAGLLLDDAAPLFWGVSAAERQPSVLDAR